MTTQTALTTAEIKRLIAATTNAEVANRITAVINSGGAVAAQTGWTVAAHIIATSTSTTTDFGALVVGDIVVMTPAAAGNSIFYTVVTAATLPAAGIVGNLYTVRRAYTLPAIGSVTL